MKIEKFLVSRDPEWYHAWPDVVLTADGTMICVFSECIHHNNRRHTRIMLCDSRDRGRTWTPKRPLSEATDGLPWYYNCPRIFHLSCGELGVIVDRGPAAGEGGSREKAAEYIRRHFIPGDRVLCFTEELPLYAGCAPLSYGEESDVATLSAGLFAALRELDDPSIHRVYARCPVGGGVAYAVQNRLKKAAAFHIIDAEVEE